MINAAIFTDVNKTAVENTLALASRAFEGVEQLTALNLQLGKTLLAESAEASGALLAARSPLEIMNLRFAALQGIPEKATAYGRQAAEIIAAVAASQRAAFETYAADMQSKFFGAVGTALKNAPGSEQTRALVKSAVDAANSVIEGATEASREVADAAEANLVKLAEGTLTNARNARAVAEA